MGLADLGHLALAGALAGAAATALGRGRWALRATAGCASAATGCLLWALVAGDFAFTYVADHTSRATPWPYRAAALWGGMEGSLLFWVEVLCLAALAADRSVRRGAPALAGGTRAVVGAVGAAFLAVVALVADPFARLAVPAVDGGGLTPILEHPAMLYHPPLLYAGYVGLTLPFALTVAALGRGRLDAAWLGLVRRWTTAAWTLLSVGVLAGAHWAYVELGWGGYWAWDPVENASLLPWLGATALLHSALVQERRGTLGAWNAGLVAATFGLSVLGTLLTRSGTAGSVHAFAEAGDVGRCLLGLLGVVVVGSAALVASRRRVAGGGWSPPSPASREAALLAGNVALLGVVAVVLWGTSFPVLSDLLGGERVAVGGRFFSLYAAPLGLVLLALVGLGPRLPWGGADGPALRRLLARPAQAGALALAAALALGVRRPFALAVFALAAFATAVTVPRLPPRRGTGSGAAPPGEEGPVPARFPAGGRRLASAAAHLGVALVLVGVAGSTLGAERTAVLAPGDELALRSYRLRFDGLEQDATDRYRSVVAVLTLRRDGRRLAALRPEQRIYEFQGRTLAEVALRSTPREDVLVTLRRVNDDGSVVVDALVRPFATLLWWGGLLVVAAGLLALRRPGRSRAPEPAAPRTGLDAALADGGPRAPPGRLLHPRKRTAAPQRS